MIILPSSRSDKVRPLESKLLWVTQKASKPHCSSFSSSMNFLSCIMKINAELLSIIREFTSPSMERRFWKRITFPSPWSLLDDGNQKIIGGNRSWLNQQSSGKPLETRSASFGNWESRICVTFCLPNPGFQLWLSDDHCMARWCFFSAPLLYSPVQIVHHKQ